MAAALIACFALPFRSEPDRGGESTVSPGERQVLVVRGVRQAMLRQTQSQGAHLQTTHRRRRRLDLSCLLLRIQEQECAQKAHEKNALKEKKKKRIDIDHIRCPQEKKACFLLNYSSN